MGHSNKQQRVLSVLCSSESDSESDSRVPTVTSINCIFDRITCFSITTVKINRMLILDSLKQCGSGYNRGRKFLPRSSLYFNWSWSVGEGWPWTDRKGENFTLRLGSRWKLRHEKWNSKFPYSKLDWLTNQSSFCKWVGL